MDSKRFDSLTRQLGAGTNRRSFLKGLLGAGGVTVTGLALSQSAEAARRGFGGPSFLPHTLQTPTPTPTCIVDGEICPANPADCCSGTCCRTISNPVAYCCN